MTEREALLSCTTSTLRGSPVATAGGVGAIFLWSTTVAVARSLSEQVGPVTAGAGVTCVASIAGLSSLLGSNRRRQRILDLPVRYLVGCGALFVGYMLALFLAIGWAKNRQQVLEVGLLNYLWPALTLLLSLPLLRKKANWILVPGTLLALTGVVLVSTQGGAISWQSLSRNVANNPAAYSLAIAAAVCWAVYSNLARKWAGNRQEGAVALFLPVTALVLLLTSCLLDEPRAWTGRPMAEAVFLGIATYIAYTLWDNAMRRGNITMVAAISYLTPLFSTIVSCLYLDVTPGIALWVGCGVLTLGSFLSWQSISDTTPQEAHNQPLHATA